MIEDGHPHVTLARLGTPALHLHVVQDLGPEAVIIPHPQNRGMTQGMKWSQLLLIFFSLIVAFIVSKLFFTWLALEDDFIFDLKIMESIYEVLAKHCLLRKIISC